MSINESLLHILCMHKIGNPSWIRIKLVQRLTSRFQRIDYFLSNKTELDQQRN